MVCLSQCVALSVVGISMFSNLHLCLEYHRLSSKYFVRMFYEIEKPVKLGLN